MPTLQWGFVSDAPPTDAENYEVTGAIEWHINVDEPPIYDYNLEFGRDAALFDDDTPYRASDHDPVIVGFDLTN